MSLIAPIAAANPAKQDGGRGGIRTHGGFPHARFRVECLKPDSATLPSKQKKRRTRNVQHTTSNATVSRLGVQRWALDVERLSLGKSPAPHAPPDLGGNTEPRAQSTARV